MNAKTYSVRESEIERRWYVVDATDETLGRLASRIARALEVVRSTGQPLAHWQQHLTYSHHPAVQRGAPRIYISHGTHDTVLPIDRCSRRIVPALQRAGAVDGQGAGVEVAHHAKLPNRGRNSSASSA